MEKYNQLALWAKYSYHQMLWIPHLVLHLMLMVKMQRPELEHVLADEVGLVEAEDQ
jgi:hypothetical protein